ncbi:MAG: hypothetical protein ABIF17_00875 [Patescibacteria group bacterium]
MANFKDYNQSQAMLLPPDIRDIIPLDHICYAIDDMVNNLDMSLVEKTYSNGTNASGSACVFSFFLIWYCL